MEQCQVELYESAFSQNPFSTAIDHTRTEKKTMQQNISAPYGDDDESNDIEVLLDQMNMKSEDDVEQPPLIPEDLLENDSFSDTLMNPRKSLKNNLSIRPWNGQLLNQYLTLEKSHDTHFHSEVPEIPHLERHLDFMKRLLNRENPTDGVPAMDDVTLNLQNAGYDHKVAASNFLHATYLSCKTEAQRHALNTITNCLESFYIHDTSNDFQRMLHPPIMVMIGVPGAGKSWIISKIRTWCSIRLQPQDVSTVSYEKNISSHHDPVSAHLSHLVDGREDGAFGRLAVLAMSGAAAGNEKGYTIHAALHFSIRLKTNNYIGC